MDIRRKHISGPPNKVGMGIMERKFPIVNVLVRDPESLIPNAQADGRIEILPDIEISGGAGADV